VKLDVRLTHGVLAGVIGARRPSVSSALRRLTEKGLTRPQSRSRWLLPGSPPAELQKLHQWPKKRSERAPGHDDEETVRGETVV
jgi:hypothetical protein